MNRCRSLRATLLFCAAAATPLGLAHGASFEAPLPPGVKVVWDLDKAFREKTPTRERICLNGLWRCQPSSGTNGETVPAEGWGFFKVPGFWPGRTSYIQEDSQTVYPHPSWPAGGLRTATAAWYQREL